jgi:hypothetical protein
VCYKALHLKHDLKLHLHICRKLRVARMCACAVNHSGAMTEHNVTCVTSVQCRTETDGPLTVQQRETGSAADLLTASYDDLLQMEQNSV